MAMIPEEFLVILTVFLSMGAWRLAKKHSLVRRLPSVETLGAVSVLCVDKTGTITMNQMSVDRTWALDGDEQNLCVTMGLGCEKDAYDPMEQAMLFHCEKNGILRKELFSGELVKEYPFTNELKMMGHVWKINKKVIIAAKGSLEKIMTICNLLPKDQKIIESKSKEMALDGLRVIAIARLELNLLEKVPSSILECNLTFCGLTGLIDPPRENISEDIRSCYQAGIRVVMITGDNGDTASSIAKKIAMNSSDDIITGSMLEKMSDLELQEAVKKVSIFSRVIPEHKMRIVKAFQANGEIVAMTGDGVNDAPALKYADIGIAMGKRGSEVSREAADLILLDDNFSTIIHTIEDGRRIYDNIRKAVGYVFTIHIPVAFASLLAPLLGIASANLFLLPLHIVLLELIIDPTCSIVLERQPAENNIMKKSPRNYKEKILTKNSFLKSIIQGFVIFAASFGTYFYVLKTTENGSLARTLGLAIIIFANLFLVQVNSSDISSALFSFKRLLKDKVMWVVNILSIGGLLLIVYTPLNEILRLTALNLLQFVLVFVIAAFSVLWYELLKLVRRINHKKISLLKKDI